MFTPFHSTLLVVSFCVVFIIFSLFCFPPTRFKWCYTCVHTVQMLIPCLIFCKSTRVISYNTHKIHFNSIKVGPISYHASCLLTNHYCFVNFAMNNPVNNNFIFINVSTTKISRWLVHFRNWFRCTDIISSYI